MCAALATTPVPPYRFWQSGTERAKRFDPDGEDINEAAEIFRTPLG